MGTKIIQKQFKRIETKYIIEKDVLPQLLEDLKDYIEADAYATSPITNIYLDTENFDLIQDSIAKRNAREKVRMRLYDSEPKASSKTFLEVKKNRWHRLQKSPNRKRLCHYKLCDHRPISN